MSGISGGAGCWWWVAQNWWRLLGWPSRSVARPNRQAPCGDRGWEGLLAGPPEEAWRMSDFRSVVPDELTLLRRIFGPDGADGAA